MAKIDITRSFIETAVSKALKDMQRDPERSVRNLVDLGKVFVKGQSQTMFLSTAQEMLRRPDSPYYQATKHVVNAIDHETLKTFGINLGYNGLTKGAKTIRGQEAARGYSVPWMLPIEYDETGDHATIEALHATITEGKSLGIYTYSLFCTPALIPSVAPLLARHTDCAFILFLRPGACDVADIDRLARFHHIMVAVHAEDAGFAAITRRLRENRCLYAAYCQYDERNISTVMDRAWAEKLVPSGCVFAILIAADGCPEATRQRAAAYAAASRGRQLYPLFVIDYYADVQAIDKTISQKNWFQDMGIQGNAKTPDLDQPAILNHFMPKANCRL